MTSPSPAKLPSRPDAVDTNTMGYDQTLGPATVAAPASPSRVTGVMPQGSRTTVLPRVEVRESNITLVHEASTRFVSVKTLGQGGVGEVELVNDEDIQRPVAVKRLRPDRMSEEGVARFVDEIRMVGQLEHPNIVPIHDVGIDDQGRYFFMMKFVDGETLEEIIRKLDAGDRTYHARYPFAVRTQIFAKVLQAISYAHANGVIHRDIKPANIMVGRFGEVMVMDWGLARKIKGRELPATSFPGSDARGIETRQDALMGTPAYMSPEQARGDNASLDERSDIYSLTVLFHELLTLRHYLAGAKDLSALLSGVTTVPMRRANIPHAHQGNPSIELVYFLERGLQKDPGQRFASVQEMMQALTDIMDGKIDVRCQLTAMKRFAHFLLRVIDDHPKKVTVATSLMGFACLACVVKLALF